MYTIDFRRHLFRTKKTGLSVRSRGMTWHTNCSKNPVDGMKETEMRKMALAMTIIFAVFSALKAEGPAYDDNSFARLSFITGDTYIQRATDLAYEEGVVNMPIAEGDRLGTTDGRAEIYLSQGNYLRLDKNTKIDFLSLPKHDSDLIQIRVWAGNIYFSLKNLSREKSIEVHTSDISFYLLDQGLYRIDVRENAETEIFVFHGIVEAAGETESVLIKDDQRLEAVQGHYTSRPTAFASSHLDSFDRWSEYRDLQVRKHLAERYLPEELEDFEYELAESGRWLHYPPYGHVWVPGRVVSGWRPYFNGRWLWVPRCGWTWLPYESWGWATFHFGRWQWGLSIGWYWIPTTIWGPAWVSWYEGPDYWGWTPLSYYDRPGVVINNIYYSNFTDAYYPHDSRSLTIVPKHMLRNRDITKASLSRTSLQKVKKINFTKRIPQAPESNQRIAVEKLGDRKVLLKSSSDTTKVKTSAKAEAGETRKIRPTTQKSVSKTRTVYGYPSSIKSSSKKLKSSPPDKEKKSTIDRIYKYISKSGGDDKNKKSSQSRVSQSSSRSKSIEKTSSNKSKSTSSRSKAKSTVKSSSSRSSTKKSTQKKSPPKTRSSSKKIKKKKK